MNIRILLSITFLLAASCFVSAQVKTFTINAQTFVTKIKKSITVKEWTTEER